MIMKKNVTDNVVMFDGTLESVKAIMTLVQKTKYNVRFADVNKDGRFTEVTFYGKGIFGQNIDKQTATYSRAKDKNGDFDYVIFHADGSFNVVNPLPNIYQD